MLELWKKEYWDLGKRLLKCDGPQDLGRLRKKLTSNVCVAEEQQEYITEQVRRQRHCRYKECVISIQYFRSWGILGDKKV